MNIVKMQEWIIERLSKTPSADEFRLMHSSVNIEGLGGGELLLKIAVGEVGEERLELESEAASIAGEAETAARAHCEAFDGTRQRYKLAADSKKDMLGTFAFVLGSKSRGIEVGISEPATERGLLGQLMRHNDSKDRAIAELVEAAMGPVVAENQSLRRQRDDWEAMRLQTFLQLEELLTHKHAREIDLAEFQEGEDRKNKFFDAFINKWGPEIIKRFQMTPAGELESKKSNGASTSSNTPPQESEVATCQTTLRDIFKILDRTAIYDVLDDEQCESLDGLLGMGEDPANIDEFKGRLANVWRSLGEDLVETIGETLMKNPEKAAAFMKLLGIPIPEES